MTNETRNGQKEAKMIFLPLIGVLLKISQISLYISFKLGINSCDCKQWNVIVWVKMFKMLYLLSFL